MKIKNCFAVFAILAILTLIFSVGCGKNEESDETERDPANEKTAAGETTSGQTNIFEEMGIVTGDGDIENDGNWTPPA